MKKISRWAKDHKWSARYIIIISHLILATLAVVTGVLLSSLNIAVSLSVLLFFIALYGIAFVLYPSRNKKKGFSDGNFYIRQKSCDFLLAASTFFMFVYMGNHPDRLFQYGSPLNATVVNNSSLPGDSAVRSYKTIAAFSAAMKNENGNTLRFKERKKLLKAQIKGIRKSDELSRGAKVALIVLSAIVALFLLYGVAALACSLSCNGSGAAALIVGIGGGALVIWLLFITIRSIMGGKRKNREEPKKEPVSNPAG